MMLLFFAFVACVAVGPMFARLIKWADTLPAPLRSADASRPECAERPALPGAVVVHLAISDRLDRRAQATPEEQAALAAAMQRLRDSWGDQVEAEELIRKVDREWEESHD